ncbi:MAG: threonylcarbamoyl-AMP synthase [Bacteroidetes bacterium MedPE-SWsnd-G2]|nr:MAG: threonylcarbamoyl-AMP synthase [Bacteroidetes bacterium MedPE-SWsnd-G2]
MQKEVNLALNVLKNGGIILYPTDTVWGLGCDATNLEAVNKIYAIKRRAESKSMICLVSNKHMLSRHIKVIPDELNNILNQSQKPTSVIYNNPTGIAQNAIAADDTIAIRIVNQEFCNLLLEQFDKPIISTSANISGESTPKTFKEISPEILKQVDYVVNLRDNITPSEPSTILKIETNGTVTVLRK